jgi:hypothetical protein
MRRNPPTSRGGVSCSNVARDWLEDFSDCAMERRASSAPPFRHAWRHACRDEGLQARRGVVAPEVEARRDFRARVVAQCGEAAARFGGASADGSVLKAPHDHRRPRERARTDRAIRLIRAVVRSVARSPSQTGDLRLRPVGPKHLPSARGLAPAGRRRMSPFTLQGPFAADAAGAFGFAHGVGEARLRSVLRGAGRFASEARSERGERGERDPQRSRRRPPHLEIVARTRAPVRCRPPRPLVPSPPVP